MKPFERGLASNVRRFLLRGLALLSIANLSQAWPRRVSLNVVLFNYLDRPIFDVFVDGKMGFGSSAYPSTGGGTVTGVRFDLGPKKVTWRLGGPEGTPRNGETVTNKNPLRLDTVMPRAKYLGVHIYPDGTVELITSIAVPDATRRGVEMWEARESSRERS